MGPQEAWALSILEQVVFREELAKVLYGEVVVRAIEGQQVEFLTLPVIDVDRAGSWVLGCNRQEEDASGHLNPPGGYGFPAITVAGHRPRIQR